MLVATAVFCDESHCQFLLSFYVFLCDNKFEQLVEDLRRFGSNETSMYTLQGLKEYFMPNMMSVFDFIANMNKQLCFSE